MDTIRRMDDIGRVTIPKEVRRVLGIKQGDPLKINVNTETGQIIMEKIDGKG